jgi:chemotaxis protein MotC
VIAHFSHKAVSLITGLLVGASGAAAAGQLSDGATLINVAAAEHTDAPADATVESATAGDGEGGDQPPPPQLWPDMPAVDSDKQPYLLVRSLRSVQDEIASGNVAAHERQRELMRDLGSRMLALPVAVWDDVRNVRAAVFFVLSGGNPTVLKVAAARPKTPFVERRAVRGALAFGEGRVVDALGLLSKLEARKLDPLLGGIVALIQGTLASKKTPEKAIIYFDEARLLSPGTLIEESALRQQILLLAREGQVERFDLLTEQYSRRFPNSLFARGFRRLFFAGVARQDYKRASEWISRTESELMKVPASERVGLYLAIAEEATKGGNIDIARFAAGKARELSQAGSRSFQRATLFEGAALAATQDYDKGASLLTGVDASKLGDSDREIRDSALAVAGAVGKWPPAPATLADAEPESVGRAQALLTKVDSLLGGQSQ